MVLVTKIRTWPLQHKDLGTTVTNNPRRSWDAVRDSSYVPGACTRFTWKDLQGY